MICPMVEQAHLGTTRYTMLSLSVIHVPGNPIADTFPFVVSLVSTADVWAIAMHQKANNRCLFNDCSRYQG